MITEEEQSYSDIEWFFTNGEEIGFVASAGGRLPDSIAKSKENVMVLALYFGNLPEICDVVINAELDKIMPDDTINEEYLSSFVSMSKRGLYSFDKTITNNFSDLGYHLVSSPSTPLKFNELPLEIAEILTETRVTGQMSRVNLSIGSFKMVNG